MDRKVLIERLALDRVMEVMDSRRDEKWLQPGEIAPEVGVYPDGVEGNEDQIRRHHRSRDANPGQCKEHADPDEQGVDGMHPGSGQPVHCLAGMMDRVQSPQGRETV